MSSEACTHSSVNFCMQTITPGSSKHWAVPRSGILQSASLQNKCTFPYIAKTHMRDTVECTQITLAHISRSKTQFPPEGVCRAICETPRKLSHWGDFVSFSLGTYQHTLCFASGDMNKSGCWGEEEHEAGLPKRHVFAPQPSRGTKGKERMLEIIKYLIFATQKRLKIIIKEKKSEYCGFILVLFFIFLQKWASQQGILVSVQTQEPLSLGPSTSPATGITTCYYYFY